MALASPTKHVYSTNMAAAATTAPSPSPAPSFPALLALVSAVLLPVEVGTLVPEVLVLFELALGVPEGEAVDVVDGRSSSMRFWGTGAPTPLHRFRAASTVSVIGVSSMIFHS